MSGRAAVGYALIAGLSVALFLGPLLCGILGLIWYPIVSEGARVGWSLYFWFISVGIGAVGAIDIGIPASAALLKARAGPESYAVVGFVVALIVVLLLAASGPAAGSPGSNMWLATGLFSSYAVGYALLFWLLLRRLSSNAAAEPADFPPASAG